MAGITCVLRTSLLDHKPSKLLIVLTNPINTRKPEFQENLVRPLYAYVWNALQLVVAEQLGVDRSVVVPNARFVQDLGAN